MSRQLVGKFHFLSAYCEAYLGHAKRRIHFDIGFGDIVVPEPLSLDFPVLLSDMPGPELITYTPESAIAEKLEAITNLNFFTSRMKDFYDIYYLANNYKFKPNLLKEAIEMTFKNRGTDLKARKILYDEKFKADKEKHQQWMAFLNRSKINIDLSFREIN
ncbi:MAG: nucleotidyl transferase AbiEii/AbiGii toxin family protein [Candidatus Cloacimonadota bacterium]|nr:nucleotidyl transferase AbiEii/AbiGii toxin family protein [Candidatus Cloacimonadota bacterium]